MMYRLLYGLARIRFTVGYLAVLVSVSVAILLLGPEAHERVVHNASTNLHNLTHGHLATLWNSAFVIDKGPLLFWLPGLACLLTLAELQLRSLRLTVAFIVGHIGATLLVAAVLLAAVQFGWLSGSITRASDVGMSYGALAALGALTAAIPRRARPAWIGWWLALALTTAVVGGDFTDAGHAVSLSLGMALAVRFARPIRWTPMRYMLLVASSGFGFVLMAHTGWTLASGVVVGAMGAMAGQILAVRGRPRSLRSPGRPLSVHRTVPGL
ncbi:rhomboid-like protein [Mycobacterium spongiae]|uniref:rhomboid-like protein n=1 Tax=Mycobacterium spongiae TaxID=886343 RepID=UPI001FE6E2C2|nr:rhomboid-like protein [Mycobacterium spongiae]